MVMVVKNSVAGGLSLSGGRFQKKYFEKDVENKVVGEGFLQKCCEKVESLVSELFSLLSPLYKKPEKAFQQNEPKVEELANQVNGEIPDIAAEKIKLPLFDFAPVQMGSIAHTKAMTFSLSNGATMVITEVFPDNFMVSQD